jgi:perosamine synthetase
MILFGFSDIRQEDAQRVADVLRSGWLVNGPVVEEAEKMFSQYTGARFAVAMNSCTAALHAACAYLRKKKGRLTLKIPDITHVATAHAAILAGHRVKLVDVDGKDGMMLPKLIDGREIVVHLAGQPCEEVTPQTIEDCAHALGTKFKDGTHAGTRGLCGCFSFYPTKHVTTAEGGMLITNNQKLAEFARLFRAFGISTPPEKRRFVAEYDSYFVAPNYRMPDVLAALLIGQLKRFEENKKHRETIARIYHENLGSCVDLPSWRKGTSWFIYQIQTTPQKRDSLIAYLKEKGIQTSIHYRRPLSAMSSYRGHHRCPKARLFAGRVVSLPVHLGISADNAQTVVDTIKDYLSHF